jgi:phosphoglycolate phosphatase
MHRDAVIFDIDGTLWDASPVSAAGWTAGLARLGIDRTISTEEIRTVTGKPYEACVDILLPGLRSRYPDLVRALNGSEEEALRARGGLFFGGAVEGVRDLSGSLKIFLVSNCQEWYLDLFLTFSGLGPVLAGSDCYGRSGRSKGAMLLGIQSDYALKRPVYVGDTAGDQAAAAEAGIEFIHVAWGFGAPVGEARTVSSFPELLEYLKGE